MDNAVKLQESTTSEIYKVHDHTTGQAVVWKVPGLGQLSNERLQSEFEICQKFTFSGVHRPLEKGLFNNSDAFCFAYIFGQSIKSYVPESGVSLERFFSLALKVVAVLEKIHDQISGHYNINWNTIIVNPESQSTHFIDFTAADHARYVHDSVSQLAVEELTFCAPECFKDNAQAVDRRSDLYSLGVLFAFLLSGKLPFRGTSPTELLDEVLTRKTIFQKDDIPDVVNQLIRRLLAVDPAQRFQNCYSLWHDLDQLRRLHDKGQLSDGFELGALDKAGEILPSQRLYGRDEELETILTNYHKLRHDGVQVLLIDGKSGVGKGKLVEAFADHLADHDIYFVHNRCQSWSLQLEHALNSALNHLAVQILSKPNEELAIWENILDELYKENGPILFRALPDLEQILSSKSIPFEKEAGEVELNDLLLKVIQKISDASISLVISLSSAQQIDPGSKEVIRLLRATSNIKDVTIVLSKDEDEMVPEENTTFIKTLWSTTQATTGVRLENWTREEVGDYIADSFNSEDIQKLADLVFEKTLGHPFFVNRIMSTIKEKSLATYNQRVNEWTVKWNRLEEITVSAHVIDYQKRAISNYENEAKEILRLAACVGLHFDLKILSHLSEIEQEQLKPFLSVFTNDYVLKEEYGQIFSWNSQEIRLGIYQEVNTGERSSVHLKIAKYLQSLKQIEFARSLTLTTAYHYDRIGENHLPEILDEVKTSFENAASESVDLAFFNLALTYYKKRLDLVSDEDWSREYSNTKTLFEKAAETAMVCDSDHLGDLWIKTLLEKSKHQLDAVTAYEIKLNYLTGKHDFVGAVKLLLEVLEQLNFTIKRHPSQPAIMKELAQTLWVLKNKKIKDLVDLPLMEDERVFSFMKLTVKGATSIFGTAPDILPIVFFRQVRFSVKYGNCVYSPFAYISFGFAISVFMNQLKKGYEFGQMALVLVDKLKAEEVRNRVLVTFYGFLSYWRDDFSASIKPLMEAYQLGKQRGDYLYASFALSFESSIRLLCGQPLGHILEEKNNVVKEVKNLNQDLLYVVTEIERQMVLNLVNPKTDVLTFDQEGFDEEAMIKKLEELEDVASKFDFYTWKLFLACIFRNWDTAYDFVLDAETFSEETTSRQINYALFLLMACIAGYKRISEGGDERNQIQKQLKAKEKTMTLFAKHAPQNFECMLDAIRACRFEAEGKSAGAEEMLLKAINGAKSSRFIHLESIFRELLSDHYLNVGNSELASWMRLKALECYKTWGATAKVQSMMKSPQSPTIAVSTSQSASIQNVHDFNTILAVNRSLANAHILNDLLVVMIDVIKKSNCATNAIIALRSKDDESIFPVAYFDDIDEKIGGISEPLNIDLPERIIRFVKRSRAILNLYNAQSNKQFRNDPYIIEKKVQSFLCLPVSVKNQIEGVICLENRSAVGAFDDAKIDFFTSIVSQFQISLDNIYVHERLEELVKERTRKLEVVNQEMQNAKEESERLLLNILPQETADELRRFGQTTAKRFDNVSVLFCDIVDFTKLSMNLGPVDLVADLDLYFKAFDDICLKHGLEKIKTVGDAYLAAGGIPENNHADANDVLDCALAMQAYVDEVKDRRKALSRSFYQIRIGVHTGSVVAGVVGSRKFQYDIWGDTVNVAARLQQSSEPGRINISQTTKTLVETKFQCTPRGKLEAKNKGTLAMYFVEGRI